MQIMDLWKSQGMDVDVITVHAEKNRSGGKTCIWTVKVNLKNNKISYKTLEVQITDLWKSRGMDVASIGDHTEKNRSGGKTCIWTVKVNLKNNEK